MITKSLTQLLTGVRAARGTVDTPSTLIPDTELTDWLNEHIRNFWQAVAPLCRDEFTTMSANQTLGAGVSTFDLSTLTGPPAFMALRGIDRDWSGGAGTAWRRVKPWRFAARFDYTAVKYHVTGKTVRFEPGIYAPGIYRFWYIGLPTEFTAGSPSVTQDFPFAGDTYVIQGAAAQVRARMEEDPAPHLALQADALKKAQHYLLQHNQGDQEAIADVSGDVYGDSWDW